jgi:hypothetical protein
MDYHCRYSPGIVPFRASFIGIFNMSLQGPHTLGPFSFRHRQSSIILQVDATLFLMLTNATVCPNAQLPTQWGHGVFIQLPARRRLDSKASSPLVSLKTCGNPILSSKKITVSVSALLYPMTTSACSALAAGHFKTWRGLSSTENVDVLKTPDRTNG